MIRAKVERFKARRVGHMTTNTRAVLPCGCSVFVGLTGENKATTGAMPCSPEHEMVTSRASGLLRESLAHPTTGQLMVNVCARMLTQAAKEML